MANSETPKRRVSSDSRLRRVVSPAVSSHPTAIPSSASHSMPRPSLSRVTSPLTRPDPSPRPGIAPSGPTGPRPLFKESRQDIDDFQNLLRFVEHASSLPQQPTLGDPNGTVDQGPSVGPLPATGTFSQSSLHLYSLISNFFDAHRLPVLEDGQSHVAAFRWPLRYYELKPHFKLFCASQRLIPFDRAVPEYSADRCLDQAIADTFDQLYLQLYSIYFPYKPPKTASSASASVGAPESGPDPHTDKLLTLWEADARLDFELSCYGTKDSVISCERLRLNAFLYENLFPHLLAASKGSLLNWEDILHLAKSSGLYNEKYS